MKEKANLVYYPMLENRKMCVLEEECYIQVPTYLPSIIPTHPIPLPTQHTKNPSLPPLILPSIRPQPQQPPPQPPPIQKTKLPSARPPLPQQPIPLHPPTSFSTLPSPPHATLPTS